MYKERCMGLLMRGWEQSASSRISCAPASFCLIENLFPFFGVLVSELIKPREPSRFCNPCQNAPVFCIGCKQWLWLHPCRGLSVLGLGSSSAGLPSNSYTILCRFLSILRYVLMVSSSVSALTVIASLCTTYSRTQDDGSCLMNSDKVVKQI